MLRAEVGRTKKKSSIKDSRVKGTRTLVDALKKAENPPKIFVSASAIGFYGNRGDEILTEESRKAKDFSLKFVKNGKIEGDKAKDFGARVVHPRIGVVLSKDGGALGKNAHAV